MGQIVKDENGKNLSKIEISWHSPQQVTLAPNRYIPEFIEWFNKNIFWADRKYVKDGGYFLVKSSWARKIHDKFKGSIEFTLNFTKDQYQLIFENFNATQRSLSTEVDFKRIIKADLYDHQKSGVEFLCGVKSAILGDDMGLGKTIQAIAWAGYMGGNTLIICPKTLVLNWDREIKKFSLTPKTYVYGTSPDSDKKGASFFIINYRKLGVNIHELLNIPFNNVIVDESHYIKNPKSSRTKRVSKLAKGIKNKLLLTGTAIKNSLDEFFPQANLVTSSFKLFNSFSNPHKRFERYYGDKDKLRSFRNLIDEFYLRRMKEEVLDLPDKIRTDVLVEVSPSFVNKFNALLEDFRYRDGRGCRRKDLLAILQKMKFLSAVSKIRNTYELAMNIIDQGNKVIIFSNFHYVIDSLLEKFGEIAVKIDGRDDTISRDMAQESFQNDPSKKVFLGGIKSASVGLTLTAAAYELFNDLAYTPADNDQAEDRAYRIGQTKTVNVYRMITSNITFDQRVASILDRKKALISTALDGETYVDDSQEKVYDELIRVLRGENTL